MIQAGVLRHVITIQRPVQTQDETGQMSTEYETVLCNVRAAIVPLSGREYVAARQVAAEVSTRITVRYYAEIDATCRILRAVPCSDVVETYDVLAVLPDPVSGRRYLNLMCAQRIVEGWRRGS